LNLEKDEPPENTGKKKRVRKKKNKNADGDDVKQEDGDA